MPTRRRLLHQCAYVSAGLLASRAPILKASGPQPPPAPDEMTRNTAPQQEHYPPPDFGPPPPALPPETLALRGVNSLKAHAGRHGILTGAAVVVNSLASDPALQQLISDQYGILVPENELKWRALRPSATVYDFAQSDQLFAFAAQRHILVRGHTLVWHNSVPDWIRAVPASQVRQLMVDHIHTVVSRYRGRVHSWDVVNEAIMPSDNKPNGLRNSFWYQAIGPDYIELAYRTAHQADPHARLAYNDYSVEYDNPGDEERRRLILALVRSLQQKKVPIHAVGIQGHLHAGTHDIIGKGLSDYLAALRSMGLDVYITELDVNEDDVATNDIAQRDQAVADVYSRFLDTALASPAVKLALTWGISDRRTWLNDGPTHHRKQPNRPQRSLPFDPQYRPTAAFFAMRDSFDRRTGGEAAPT